MYLSKLKINPAYPGIMRDVADLSRLHKRLMKAFPEVNETDARREMGILFRVETETSGVSICVQSAVKPDWNRLEARSFLAAPQLKSVDEAIGSIREGRTLRFRIKANPTRKVKVPGKKNGKRVGLVKEEEQAAWLQRRAATSGFEVNHVLIRKDGLVGACDGKAFESVLFEGILTVVDQESFLRTIELGIGSGKAYGFGLLSLAPVRSGIAA